MFKRPLDRKDIWPIAANLIPVYGVWFLGWNAREVFTVYAMETLIVGMMTILKLGVMTVARRRDTWYNKETSTQVSGLFFVFFFTIHYGLFAAVQSTIFSQTANITPPGSGTMHFFFHWWEYVNDDIAVMLAGFTVSYFATSFVPFIVRGDYKHYSMMRVMFQPYGRIFIQQFTVILGAMFLSFNWNKGFILVFAAAKIFFDVYINFDRLIDKSMEDLGEEKEKRPGTRDTSLPEQ